MDNENPDEPVIRAVAVWTRADALRVGHQVAVCCDEKALWAQVTSIEATDQPERLRLQLVPETDGTLLQGHTHTMPMDTAVLRLLASRVGR